MENCITQGLPVPGDLIDPLLDSSNHIGHPDALTGRMTKDGYLFLKGVLDREEVLAARTEVFERLAKQK